MTRQTALHMRLLNILFKFIFRIRVQRILIGFIHAKMWNEIEEEDINALSVKESAQSGGNKSDPKSNGNYPRIVAEGLTGGAKQFTEVSELKECALQ